MRAELAKNILDYVKSSATGFAMLICFFSLVASMYSNILEQKKEIAVLRYLNLYINILIYFNFLFVFILRYCRVLGVEYFQLLRLYIEEAFIIVVSSSLVGMYIRNFLGIFVDFFFRCFHW